jgi:hypothetical protein
MTCFRALPLIALLLGCQQYPEIEDYGGLCVRAEQGGDKHLLVVLADSHDCASDHEGATFECSISIDGSHAHVETVFQDGKDPNDACAQSLQTMCQVEVEPGTYTIEFAGDDTQMITVPSDEVVCLAGGALEAETGG